MTTEEYQEKTCSGAKIRADFEGWLAIRRQHLEARKNASLCTGEEVRRGGAGARDACRSGLGKLPLEGLVCLLSYWTLSSRK